ACAPAQTPIAVEPPEEGVSIEENAHASALPGFDLLVGQGLEEPAADLGAPAKGAEQGALLLRLDGPEPRHRHLAARDHDLLAAGNFLDQSRQMGLRRVNRHYLHWGSTNMD